MELSCTVMPKVSKFGQLSVGVYLTVVFFNYELNTTVCD